MKRIALLLLIAAAGCAYRPPPGHPDPMPTFAFGTAQGLFRSMRMGDTAAIRALFTPDARIVSIGRNERWELVYSHRSVSEFIAAVAQSPVPLIERTWDEQVLVDPTRALATLWAPYEFHRGEEFSHCGVDSFQMAWVDGNFRITSLSYTVQRSDCPPAPPRRFSDP